MRPIVALFAFTALLLWSIATHDWWVRNPTADPEQTFLVGQGFITVAALLAIIELVRIVAKRKPA